MQLPEHSGKLLQMGGAHIHVSENQPVDAGSCLYHALDHCLVLCRRLQQLFQKGHHLDAEHFFGLNWERRTRESLGEEVGAPTPDIEMGGWTDDGHDARDDSRVMVRIGEDMFTGLLELRDLMGYLVPHCTSCLVVFSAYTNICRFKEMARSISCDRRQIYRSMLGGDYLSEFYDEYGNVQAGSLWLERGLVKEWRKRGCISDGAL